jgi:ectoine hydroxylase-related dioxygenase (phytanoyl-CoA dioxygenase family)
LNTHQLQRLDRDGYLVLPGVLSRRQVDHLNDRLEELWRQEGERAGEENYIEKNALRLANLVNKGDVFREMFSHSLVLDAVRAVLGPQVRLSMLNARAVPPHSDPEQPLHTDADHGAGLDDKGYIFCTAIWMLDDFTPENGATRIVPGTHRRREQPKQVMADTRAAYPGEAIVEGKAGDVLVFNGHCWHAGRANITDAPRRAILVHYIRADHPQRLNQKEHVSPELQTRLNPLEREILGLDD